MTDILLWASILGLFGPLIPIMPLNFGKGSPVVVTTKFLRDGRYILLRVSILGLFACWPRVTRRPPSHQNLKNMTDKSLLESILVLFGPLISIKQLDFKSAPLPAGQGSPAARCHIKISKFGLGALYLERRRFLKFY